MKASDVTPSTSSKGEQGASTAQKPVHQNLSVYGDEEAESLDGWEGALDSVLEWLDDVPDDADPVFVLEALREVVRPLVWGDDVDDTYIRVPTLRSFGEPFADARLKATREFALTYVMTH